MDNLPVFVVPLLGYLLGVGVRVVWPYFLVWLETGAAFDWRYVGSQLGGALIGLIPTLALGSFLSDLPALGFFGALAAGYLAGNAGRAMASAIEKRE